MQALFSVVLSLFVTAGAAPQAIPAQFVDGRVLINATVNGKPMVLHLDSGTSGVVLDTAAARDAGLTVAKGMSTADIDIGSLHASNVAVAVANYGRRIPGAHVSGLIGGPFFESNVVTIDYPHRRLIVTPHSAFDPQTMTAKPTALIELYHGLATVPVWFGSTRARMLFRPFADRIGLNTFLGTHQICTFGGQCIEADEFEEGPITVGTTQFRRADVDVPSQPLLSTKYYDGILGRDVLEQFAITFDYADNAVYFNL